jgi:hypothetical protein
MIQKHVTLALFFDRAVAKNIPEKIGATKRTNSCARIAFIEPSPGAIPER